MTEIGKISSNAQVPDLIAPKPAKQPASDDVVSTQGSTAERDVQSTDLELQLVGPKPKLAADEASPLERAAEALQKLLPEEEQTPNTRLRIDKDDETGRFIYQNVDAESGEVLKQFPPESILEFLSFYRDVAGLAVDDKA